MGRSGTEARHFNPHTLTPRMKAALRLYGTGAVRTQKEACEAVGLNTRALAYRKWMDPRVDIFLAKLDQEIDAGTVDMSRVLVTLGRKAVVNIAKMAESATKEDVRFRANQDLADRSPETQKTHKLRMEEDIRMTPESIEALRAALLESARARVDYAEVIEGDYITVDEESSQRHLAQLPSPSSNGTRSSVP